MSGIRSFIKKILVCFDLYHLKGKNKYWITFWYRPKYATNVGTVSKRNYFGKVAIVIQGPLIKDFTYQTVLQYKNMFPGCILIVSTWEKQAEAEISRIRGLDVHIIVSEELPSRMSINRAVNFQKETSMKGVKLAKELNAEFTLKVRSDQRVYDFRTIDLLIKLLEKFPIKVPGARDRIVSCSDGTFANRLYNVSDMFLFGRTEDMINYFSCPFDERKNVEYNNAEDFVSYSKLRPGEIWFTTHYLEKCGNKLQWTFEDSDRLRNDYFIIVDCEMVDLFWGKYTDMEYMWRSYEAEPTLRQVRFSDWLISQQKG